MSEQTVYQENVFFKPMQFLYELLNANVKDVNEARSTAPDPHDRQWIFPDVPEANDENYPRIALVPGTITIEEYGAGRYIETVTDDLTGAWKSETRGVIASIPMTIGIFVKKKQRFSVDLLNGNTTIMQNTKLSDYIGYQIIELLIKKRSEFITKQMDLSDISSSQSYEDGQFWYAKEVTFTMNLWMAIQEYFDPASLIAQIDLTFNVANDAGDVVSTETISHFAP